MISARGTNGTITFDGHAIVLDRKGLIARTTVGKGTKTIPIGQVVAVQWKPAGLSAGIISFTIAGGNEVRSRFGSQAIKGMKDENSVAFHVHRQRDFEQIRDVIQAAINAPVSAAPPIPAAPPPQGPPAGWYTDPQGQAAQRWWDGTAWTEHIQ